MPSLRLLIQLAGAASMVYIGIEATIAAVREWQDEGRTARAWRDATKDNSEKEEGNVQEPAQSTGIDRGSDRDSGTGVRDIRGDDPERGADSRD